MNITTSSDIAVSAQLSFVFGAKANARLTDTLTYPAVTFPLLPDWRNQGSILRGN